MASRNISIHERAYQRLRRERRKGESFTDVVLRFVPSRRSPSWDLVGRLDAEEGGRFQRELKKHRREQAAISKGRDQRVWGDD